MKNDILLGYAIPSGDPVSVPAHHLIVAGITRLSGKTTTLEALIARSERRGLVFRTKRGELGFSGARPIAPYFEEKSDWQYVASLLEATMRERMKFERSWIIDATKGARTLDDVYARLKKMQREAKRGLDQSILTNLIAYFDLVLPELRATTFSKKLELGPGLNIMDLEALSAEVQQLVIRSTLEHVFEAESGVVIVIPEAQDFVPEGRGTPVKAAALDMVRKGASMGNYVWFDSQSITGVDKALLKQCEVWLLGRQRELNEATRTLQQLPLLRAARPDVAEIMQLPIGQFFACFGDKAIKTYIQPSWLPSDKARSVARGDELVSIVVRPSEQKLEVQLMSIDPMIPKLEQELRLAKEEIRRQEGLVRGLRSDLDGSTRMLAQLRGAGRAFFEALGLTGGGTSVPVDIDALAKAVAARMPAAKGSVTTLIKPVEALRDTFREEAVQRLLGEIQELQPVERKALQWILAVQRPVTATQVGVGLGFAEKDNISINRAMKPLLDRGLVAKDNKWINPTLKDRLDQALEVYSPTDEVATEVMDRLLFLVQQQEAAA